MKTPKPKVKDVKEAYLIIGTLVAACSNLEYFINILIEQLFSSNTAIDTIQRKDVVTRWNIAKETIYSQYGEVTEEMNQSIITIDTAIKFYEANVKEKRNMAAHGFLISHEGKPPKIVQSKRYKEQGMNDLKIEDIKSVLEPFGKHLSNVLPAISKAHGKKWQKLVQRKIED